MSVESTTNRKAYTGDGVTTAFPTTFLFLDDADLVVLLKVISTGVETTQTLTTHYTVSGGDGATGTVTMLTAPTALQELIIYNDPAITQPLDLLEGDASPAETKEQAWDRLTYIALRLSDRVDRSIRLAEGFTDTFDTSLPALLTASTVLGINADGDGFDLFELGDGTNVGLPSSPGMVAYTGSGLFTDRSLATSGNGISVSNGDGQSGNPTFALDSGIFALVGALLPDAIANLGLANATTTNAADSIKIQGAAAALSATNILRLTLPTVSSPGRVTAFSATADVTINLTGAHWGMGTKGDFTDRILRVYAINDNGSLKWGVSNEGGKRSILDTNSHTTATSCTTQVKMLVNSALSAGTWPCREVGWFLADFDDTGGAAEDLWTVQTGAGEIVVGRPAPVRTAWESWTPTGSQSTNTTYTGMRRRNGDSMEYWVRVAYAGAPTAADLSINLGQTIDLNKILASGYPSDLFGHGVLRDASATAHYALAVGYTGETAVAVYHALAAAGNSGIVNATSPVTIASGDVIDVRFTVPLVGFSDN